MWDSSRSLAAGTGPTRRRTVVTPIPTRMLTLTPTRILTLTPTPTRILALTVSQDEYIGDDEPPASLCEVPVM